MIKVKVLFVGGSFDEFYADELGQSCNEGYAIYWSISETNKVVTYTINNILKIEEAETR